MLNGVSGAIFTSAVNPVAAMTLSITGGSFQGSVATGAFAVTVDTASGLNCAGRGNSQRLLSYVSVLTSSHACSGTMTQSNTGSSLLTLTGSGNVSSSITLLRGTAPALVFNGPAITSTVTVSAVSTISLLSGSFSGTLQNSAAMTIAPAAGLTTFGGQSPPAASQFFIINMPSPLSRPSSPLSFVLFRFDLSRCRGDGCRRRRIVYCLCKRFAFCFRHIHFESGSVHRKPQLQRICAHHRKHCSSDRCVVD